MTDESKAVPLLQDASTSKDLRSLLMFAREQGPAQDDLDRLSKRLSPLVGLSVTELSVPQIDLGTAPANPPGLSPSLAAGKGALVKVGLSSLSKAIVAAGIVSAGVVWWALPAARISEPVRASKAANRVEVVAPTMEQTPEVVPTLRPPEPVPVVEPIVPAVQPTRSVRTRVAEPKPAPLPIENPSEMDLIRRAEDSRTEPAQALRALNEHARLYPEGMLAQEREVLAIEALLAAGQRPAAEARASQLAAKHPGSAHLRRVRVLLGAGTVE